MIRLATYNDIDSLLIITKACAAYMIKNTIYQWNETYPNQKVFEQDVKRKELYVLKNHNKLIGCIVISTKMDAEYKGVKWLTSNNNNIYIHRLAIHPNQQGKGYAQKLMGFAESFAISNNYTSIRLDTFSQNTRNQKFYELRGYKKLGNVYFPKQSEHPFYCYEFIM